MYRIGVIVLFILVVSPVAANVGNQLTNHPSPYLALHADDPVHWRVWGRDALKEARSQNRPLFISSGYFACHWCHVMQQESYQDPELAAFLNEHFVPVKVDRELHPALDAHLIEFVQRTRGSAGWPLNVFLTPEGYPLVGLTYAPRDNFFKLLRRLAGVWNKQSSELKVTAREAMEKSASRTKPVLIDRPDPKLLSGGLVRMALALGDEMEGGFGEQNRFPMSPQWQVLLGRLESSPNEALRELTVLTLDQMASQGLRDHLEGGFFRYTVDPGWQVPHYEKMLYTQALLSLVYLKGAAVLKRPDYLEVAQDTLDFSLKTFQRSNGGFIASLSAVDNGSVEGGGYLWSDDQLSSILNSQELDFARKRWRLSGTPVSEGGYLPVQGASLESLARREGKTIRQLSELEERVRNKLQGARVTRRHPSDEKQLAAWNALMLSALVEGHRVLGHERYRVAAAKLRDFLMGNLWNGSELYRARDGDRSQGSAALEDYVYLARAMADWGRLADSEEDLQLSGRLQTEAWKRFFHSEGWQASDELLIPGIASKSAIADGPLPSPAAMLIELGLLSKDMAIRKQAHNALTLGYRQAISQPLWYATQVDVSLRVNADPKSP